MNEVPATYVVALAAQIASLSAFLGGFSATYLATLLSLGSRGRAAGIAIACAVLASVAFIVSMVGATTLMTGLHPDAPPLLRETMPLGFARVLMPLGFALGLYAALTSLAVSGWSRSRRTGMVTTAVAGTGALLVTLLTVGFQT